LGALSEFLHLFISFIHGVLFLSYFGNDILTDLKVRCNQRGKNQDTPLNDLPNEFKKVWKL